MKTAIIGLGNIGSRLAANLVAGDELVIVSARDVARARALAQSLGPNARALPIETALREADVIVLAMWFDVIKDFVVRHHAELAGKIVVDPSNPIALDGGGGSVRTLEAGRSAGQVIAGLLPEGAEQVKAFSSLTAESLASAAHRPSERKVMFYATDYPEAARVISRLIRASGFAPVCVGGIDQAVRIEAFGDLVEVGPLGRLVTEAEARELVGAGGSGGRRHSATVLRQAPGLAPTALENTRVKWG